MGVTTESPIGTIAGDVPLRAASAPNRTTTLSAPTTTPCANARSALAGSAIAVARETTGATHDGSTSPSPAPQARTAVRAPTAALRPPGRRTMRSGRQAFAIRPIGIDDEQPVVGGEGQPRTVGRPRGLRARREHPGRARRDVHHDDLSR